MKEFIEYLVKNIVNDHRSVNIQCFEGQKGVIVEIKVAQPDIGKVIGNHGKTIKALRTIAMMVGAKLSKKIKLEIIE